MLRAVLFDLDGTLADTEGQCAESLARALLRAGRVITAEERAFVIGHGWREIHANLLAGGPVPWGLEELVARAGEERERLTDEEGLRVLPGAVELLRAAAARMPVGVVSGSSRAEIASCLMRIGVGGLVRSYVGAEDVARGKPAPDGYLLGAERLGVLPAEVVAIEDSTAGIAAARAAGMAVVAARAGNFAGQDQSEADLLVDTLREIDVDRLSALRAAIHLVHKASP
jgi:HAD superfamily hydrolase (TIGR01509 family)